MCLQFLSNFFWSSFISGKMHRRQIHLLLPPTPALRRLQISLISLEWEEDRLTRFVWMMITFGTECNKQKLEVETVVDQFTQAPAAPSDDLLQLQGNPFANMMNGELPWWIENGSITPLNRVALLIQWWPFRSKLLEPTQNIPVRSIEIQSLGLLKSPKNSGLKTTI